ncbi:mCG1035565 [Mus musculus]|nr:mCG1035565 [Mus musculus]
MCSPVGPASAKHGVSRPHHKQGSYTAGGLLQGQLGLHSLNLSQHLLEASPPPVPPYSLVFLSCFKCSMTLGFRGDFHQNLAICSNIQRAK